MTNTRDSNLVHRLSERAKTWHCPSDLDWSDLITYYGCMMQLMYDSSWQPGYSSTPGYCLMIERRSVFNLCRVFSVLCGDQSGMWGGTRMTRHKTQPLSLPRDTMTEHTSSLSLLLRYNTWALSPNYRRHKLSFLRLFSTQESLSLSRETIIWCLSHKKSKPGFARGYSQC